MSAAIRRTLAVEIAGVLFLYFGAWAVIGGRPSFDSPRAAVFASLVVGQVLLPTLVVAAAGAALGRGISTFRAAALGGFIGILGAWLGGWAFGLMGFGSSVAVFQRVIPALALFAAAAWLAETVRFDGRTHGVLALALATTMLVLPFLLDRGLAETADFEAAYARRAQAFRVAAPLASADALAFDFLRAPRVYAAYRLGEGSFEYPTARETALFYLAAAAGVLVLFWGLPTILMRRRPPGTPGF